MASDLTGGAVIEVTVPVGEVISSEVGNLSAPYIANAAVRSSLSVGMSGAFSGESIGFTSGTAETLKNGGNIKEAVNNGIHEGNVGAVTGLFAFTAVGAVKNPFEQIIEGGLLKTTAQTAGNK